MIAMTATSFAFTATQFIPSAPVCLTTESTDGLWNAGSPLYIPAGVSVQMARAPQLHCQSNVGHFASPPAPTDSSSTNGVLNIQAPLYIPHGSAFAPLQTNIRFDREHAAPPPRPQTPPPTPKPNKAEYNGHRNIPSELFTPSEADLKKVEEQRERLFWESYKIREEERKRRLAASIFPHPLPKPKQLEDRPFVRQAPLEVVVSRIHHMERLVESMAQFIGI